MAENCFFLGFDGGGTKTDCALLDQSGAVLAEARAGPANPLRVGFDAACAALRGAAERTLASSKIEPGAVRAACAGLAGASRASVTERIKPFLAELFPAALVEVTTDYQVALEAAAGAGPGVILIAGTGSVAYGRNAARETGRAGGWGPWVGDEGSAFDIGRRAVSAVAHARDELAPATALEQKIMAEFGLGQWSELTEHIARGPDRVFPRIFPPVVEAAEAGDSVAREILATAAEGLGQIASSVIRRLGLAGEEFVLAKAGGVFGRTKLLDSPLDAALERAAPRAHIEPVPVSPAVGAARLAMRLAAQAGATGKSLYGAKA